MEKKMETTIIGLYIIGLCITFPVLEPRVVNVFGSKLPKLSLKVPTVGQYCLGTPVISALLPFSFWGLLTIAEH